MKYKYRSFNSEFKFQVFTEGKLYFSKPSQFNDPFELKPKIVGLGTLEKRKEFVDNFEKRNLMHLNFKRRKVEKQKALIRLTNSNLVETDIHELLDSYGVFSVSKKWDHILMWSHYSDSHQGFCVGFELDDDYDDEMGVALPVSYTEKYPEFSPKDINNRDEFFRSTVASKASVWSYEEEIRYVKLNIHGGNGLYNISPCKIKEVILGACIGANDANEIKSVVSEKAPWIRLFQAKLSSSTYSIYRDEIRS